MSPGPNVIEVNDPADKRIEVFQGLRDAALRQRRERPGGDMAGVFIAEGDIVIERGLAAGFDLISVLVDAARSAPWNVELPASVPVYAAGPQVLEQIAGFHSYRGAMACFARRAPTDPAHLAADETLRTVLVTEGVNNPVNLGVILRSAVGLGIDALFHDPTSCDPFSRRCCRVSMGEAFGLPSALLPPIPQGLELLTEHGFTVFGLSPRADAESISQLRFPPTERIALLLGAEGPGLTDAALTGASRLVRIPMSGTVDSLNVGAAAAVAFYAFGRARQGRAD